MSDSSLLLQRAAILPGRNTISTACAKKRVASMSTEKEVLATELGIDGIQAWGRLYDTISAKLEFDMVYPDGRRARLPISQRRSLMEDPDRRVRKAAFEGGNTAWQIVEDIAAAALNAIAGTRLTLNRHRGVEHFLDIALFQASITRKTLDAHVRSAVCSPGNPPADSTAKSQIDGAQRGRLVRSRRAAGFAQSRKAFLGAKRNRQCGESFSRAYPALGKFFHDQVIGKNWVDWEPRPGKRPGGFCTSSMLSKESRIFMTFNESLGDMLTLAHESGHAFHGALMRDIRPYARGYPMTLAETASTFGENVLDERHPRRSDRQRRAESDDSRYRSRPRRGLSLGHSGALRI